MATGNKFFDDLPEKEQKQFAILFEDKSSWYTEDENGFKNWNNSQRKIEKFNLSLKSFIALQSNQDQYNFYYIHFPLFDIKKLFSIITLKDDFTVLGCVFYGKIDFKNFIFEKEFYLENCTFFDDCIFYDAVFKQKFTLSDCIFFGYINFIYSHFIDTSYFALLTCFKDVDFSENTFEKRCFLHYSDFYGNLSFEGSVFKKNSLIKNINFFNINLTDAEFNNLSLLGLNSLNQINIPEIINNKISTKLEEPILSPISQKNFADKESARLIKDYFEKQNNITEANKYFVIEQEKYIEELEDKENKTEGGKWVKLIPLYLNKYVSNFGTDWIRGLLILSLFGYLVLFSYMILKYSLFIYPNQFYMAGDWRSSNLATTLFDFIIISFLYIINLKFKKIKYFFWRKLPDLKRYSIVKRYEKIFWLFRIIMNIKKYTIIFLTVVVIFIVFYLSQNHTTNLISQLLNPINAFKDDDTFKGYEAFGVMVRIISATIIYQIIVAFRQFTRRG